MSTDNDRFRLRPGHDTDGDAIVALVFPILRAFGLEPEPDGIDGDLRRIDAEYWRRGGEFWVLEDGPRIVGCFGLYPLTDVEVELRKLYLSPVVHGRGLGRFLLEQAISRAKQRGFVRLSLETEVSMQAAIALYRAAGFIQRCGADSGRCNLAFILELDKVVSGESQ